ncbi:MAG TPA: hypothetical protein VG676_00445 [Chitinophagaceae bacterium]|jgi:hypothetical protein|nr:hypothetical protein [Chitinophagaceae bacterium]
MKRVFRNNRLILIAFFTIFSVAGISAAKAAEKNPELPVELKYVGKIGYKPLLELNINGSTNEGQYRITVKDEYDNSLYSENVKAEIFSKKFLLNVDEINGPVTFEVSERKTGKTVSFQVKQNTRYVDQMEINVVN